MKNEMQFKALMKNVAKEKGISAQSVAEIYLFELLLERIAKSEFRNHIVLKGGFLIASMVGIQSRTTMDMDLTLRNYPLTIETAEKMFQKICFIENDDDFCFEYCYTEPIRKEDEYEGFRVHFKAHFKTLAVDMKLDITTGDVITPEAIEYCHKTMLSEKTISVFAYNLETVLAEKLETVISRSIANTRLRDFYDIYILSKIMDGKIDCAVLSQALKLTCNKRESFELIKNYSKTCDLILNDKTMNDYWEKYQNDFQYAKNVSFSSCIEAVKKLLSVSVL